MRKSSKKKYIIVALIVLLLALAVGYAAFTDTLTISGTASAKGTFNLEFTKATLDKSEGVTVDDTTPENGTYIKISDDKDTVNVVVKDLAYPGAGAQFTVVIKNVGTTPAVLKSVTPVGINDDDIKVTFPDGLVAEEKIAAQGECTITFTVEWDKNSTLDTSTLGETGKTLDFSLTLEYEQDTTPFNGAASHS